MLATKDRVRIAAVGDIHCGRRSQGELQSLFAHASDAADVLALCGDLTDYGLPEEARVLTRELGTAKLPIVAVFGNHEYESDQHDEVRQILGDAGVIVLDGDCYTLHGIGFVGVKGFGGGFGQRSLEPWGEEPIKRFVREAVEESLKLESALARLTTDQRVVLLHYAPIRATVEGESPETFAFLGSSRLEDPLLRYPVTAVFHGHAHHGTLEGRTANDVPVYNVAAPLLRQHYPDRPPFRLLELPIQQPAEPPARPAPS